MAETRYKEGNTFCVSKFKIPKRSRVSCVPDHWKQRQKLVFLQGSHLSGKQIKGIFPQVQIEFLNPPLSKENKLIEGNDVQTVLTNIFSKLKEINLYGCSPHEAADAVENFLTSHVKRKIDILRKMMNFLGEERNPRKMIGLVLDMEGAIYSVLSTKEKEWSESKDFISHIAKAMRHVFEKECGLDTSHDVANSIWTRLYFDIINAVLVSLDVKSVHEMEEGRRICSLLTNGSAAFDFERCVPDIGTRVIVTRPDLTGVLEHDGKHGKYTTFVFELQTINHEIQACYSTEKLSDDSSFGSGSSRHDFRMAAALSLSRGDGLADEAECPQKRRRLNINRKRQDAKQTSKKQRRSSDDHDDSQSEDGFDRKSSSSGPSSSSSTKSRTDKMKTRHLIQLIGAMLHDSPNTLRPESMAGIYAIRNKVYLTGLVILDENKKEGRYI